MLQTSISHLNDLSTKMFLFKAVSVFKELTCGTTKLILLNTPLLKKSIQLQFMNMKTNMLVNNNLATVFRFLLTVKSNNSEKGIDLSHEVNKVVVEHQQQLMEIK